MANIIDSLKLGSNTGVFTLPCGSCSTAADTAAKTVAVQGNNFSLETNAIVVVTFTITNTASNPTLDVSSSGAKSIYYNGTNIDSKILIANKSYIFIYDGTNWNLVGDVSSTLEWQSF